MILNDYISFIMNKKNVYKNPQLRLIIILYYIIVKIITDYLYRIIIYRFA